MKHKLSAFLLILAFAASGIHSFALGSITPGIGEVICYSDGAWYIQIVLMYDLPLTDDDGMGGDFVAVYLYEDYAMSGIGIGASTDAATYPWQGGVTLLHTYASTVSVIAVDVTSESAPEPWDYESVLARGDVLASISANREDYCGPLANEDAAPVTAPPDERINWHYGDLNAVLYRGEDEQGNPALNLYCYDGETASLGFQITSANMGDAPIEAEGCDATFYILESGELQVNIRDAEGKWYEIICADLACEAPVLRYFDPNE